MVFPSIPIDFNKQNQPLVPQTAQVVTSFKCCVDEKREVTDGHIVASVWLGRGGLVYVVYNSGQIVATSHDLTPNGGLVREIPLFQGNLGWWNIIIWPDNCFVELKGIVGMLDILK